MNPYDMARAADEPRVETLVLDDGALGDMDVTAGLDLGDLDLTTGHDVELADLAHFEEDLERFQSDEFVQAALQKGVDLRDYSRQLDRELREVEVDSVKDYVEQSAAVVDLHGQMQACDGILARMQEMLLGFQADLGGISEEIRHLQDKSLVMNFKLKNRRAAEEKLGAFLSHVAVPPELATGIVGMDVSDTYLEYVVALNSKLQYAALEGPPEDGSSLSLAPRDTVAGHEVLPYLRKLQDKAVAKAREYLLSRIADLRKPKTNVQVIQKHALLKYKFLMTFLMEQKPDVAGEVRGMYIESMGRTLFLLFKAYYAQLNRLDLQVANKHDLIAIEETAIKGLLTTKVNLSKRADAFCLGGREELLADVEAPPILVHIAQAEASRYPFEALFRSIMKHLMDTACNEQAFVSEFFMDKSNDTFMQIFARTLSLCLENLENYLFSCHDAVGLLIMIKTSAAQRALMLARKITVLDAFFEKSAMLLWPRFKAVMDANMRSVRAANPKRLGAFDLTPHYVTRRYAEFSASMRVLCTGLDAAAAATATATAGLDASQTAAAAPQESTYVGASGFDWGGSTEESLTADLEILETEFTQLLSRLASQHQSKKERMVFLINNYDAVLAVYTERRVLGDHIGRFDGLLATQRELFVEEELADRFTKLIAFVHAAERGGAGSGPPAAPPAADETAAVERLVSDFGTTWKAGIESINADVMAFFADFRNGMEILKQALTQLLLYYTRFQESLKRKGHKAGSPALKNIVSTAAILAEIKKYSRTF